MNCITIKDHATDGLVAVETYDTDTDAMGGFTVSALDLWRWLWRRRPCQVQVKGRIYSLQHPVVPPRRPGLNAYRRVADWRGR